MPGLGVRSNVVLSALALAVIGALGIAGGLAADGVASVLLWIDGLGISAFALVGLFLAYRLRASKR